MYLDRFRTIGIHASRMVKILRIPSNTLLTTDQSDQSVCYKNVQMYAYVWKGNKEYLSESQYPMILISVYQIRTENSLN